MLCFVDPQQQIERSAIKPSESLTYFSSGRVCEHFVLNSDRKLFSEQLLSDLQLIGFSLLLIHSCQHHHVPKLTGLYLSSCRRRKSMSL